MTSLLEHIRGAQREDAFFDEFRAQRPPVGIVFTRPSQSVPGREHRMVFSSKTLEPADMRRPCTCPAGAEGRLCWALLDVLRREVLDEALRRWATADPCRFPPDDLVADVVRRAELAGQVIDERAKHGGAFPWRR